ncbi:MAG TPA: hypothetical protein ENN85_07155 [Methanoculleus sp.]|nr:hypothetical protein [Methanoculleus sp.]
MRGKLVSAFILIALLATLIPPAQAGVASGMSGATTSAVTLNSHDYFNIFVAALIILNVFFVLLYKISRRQSPKKEISRFVHLVVSLLAFLLIAIGSVLVIIVALVLITISTDITAFSSAFDFFTYFFTEGSTVFGIILAGSSGLLLFLIGYYMLILLHGNPLTDTTAMPTGSGAVSKGTDLQKTITPTNPNLRFKVVKKDTGKPVPDVKVILKKREGITFHTKFTDFNGEVRFENVEGHAYDWQAFVEGDETREMFRVMQV